MVVYITNEIPRHAMAILDRRVGGILDTIIAMTGHKDLENICQNYPK